MSAPVIYHLTTLQEWEEAQDKGVYEAKSYQEYGYIHCATEEQLDYVMKTHFKDHQNLVKLVIDPLRLTQHLKYEKSSDSDQEFPHIYGPLNIQAVTEIVLIDPITQEED